MVYILKVKLGFSLKEILRLNLSQVNAFMWGFNWEKDEERKAIKQMASKRGPLAGLAKSLDLDED